MGFSSRKWGKESICYMLVLVAMCKDMKEVRIWLKYREQGEGQVGGKKQME